MNRGLLERGDDGYRAKVDSMRAFRHERASGLTGLRRIVAAPNLGPAAGSGLSGHWAAHLPPNLRKLTPHVLRDLLDFDRDSGLLPRFPIESRGNREQVVGRW